MNYLPHKEPFSWVLFWLGPCSLIFLFLLLPGQTCDRAANAGALEDDAEFQSGPVGWGWRRVDEKNGQRMVKCDGWVVLSQVDGGTKIAGMPGEQP